MQKVKLEFTVDELQILEIALGKMPYENAVGIIQSIKNQLMAANAESQKPTCAKCSP